MSIVFNAAFLVISIAAGLMPQDSGSAPADPQNLVGEWRGQSICQVRRSACRDEDSVYRIKAVDKKPGWFSLEGGRIANGRIVNMGVVDCSFDAKQQLLECNLAAGVIRLSLQGDRLGGTMELPDKTVWRKIDLKKTS